MMLTRQNIRDDLKGLGLAGGGLVIVHSSLSSLGQVDGGADAVIDALLEVIGSEGTLVMPSFQAGGEHDLLRRGCVFDLRTSASQVGIIPETFRQRPGVMRSINPTHCTAALGKRAEEILDGHQYCNVSVGKNSPYDKLARAGGKILLLGVEHSSNTSLHLAENISGAPTVCRELFHPLVIDTQGRTWTVPTHSHMPGLQRRYPRVEEELLAAGIQKNAKVGQALSRLIQAGPMVELIGQRVRENPVYLCNVFTP
jgi:aminoglycoside 3-N-acetyltransferase